MSELQHPDSRSFESVAELYERARPAYPREAVEWLAAKLGLDGDSAVLDLGAGTGKLTRELLRYAARVIAVEPGPEMLAQLERAVPEAEPVLGAAEAIPLADASVEAITCGQSFHWFRYAEALPEMHRVLREGGAVGLVWNNRDQRDELQREISDLIWPLTGGRAAAYDSSRHLAESRFFGPVEEREFAFAQELDADRLAERVGSISFVAAAPAETRARIERRLRELAAEGGDVVRFPYVTSVYVSRAA